MSQQDHEDEFPHIPLSEIKSRKAISDYHEDDDRYAAVDRYDTAVGVVLAFAMAIGVWLYAIKPWQKTELPVDTHADLTTLPLANDARTALIAPSPTPTHAIPVASTEDEFAFNGGVNPPKVSTQSAAATIKPAIVPSPVAVSIVPTVVPATPEPEIVTPSPLPTVTMVPTLVEPIATPIASPEPSPAPVLTPVPTAAPVVESLPAVKEVAVEPEAASAEAIPVNPTVVVRESIEFAMGSAVLPEEAKAHLMEVAESLKADARQLKIVGHTDSIGFTGANRRLSLRRALAVQRFLVANGVPADHLSVAGAGESRPIDTNDTPEGRHHNRRIEIIE